MIQHKCIYSSPAGNHNFSASQLRGYSETDWNVLWRWLVHFKNISNFRSLQKLERFLLTQRNLNNTTHSPVCIISIYLQRAIPSTFSFPSVSLSSAFLIHCVRLPILTIIQAAAPRSQKETNTMGCRGTIAQECPSHQEREWCKASIKVTLGTCLRISKHQCNDTWVLTPSAFQVMNSTYCPAQMAQLYVKY